MRVVLHLANCFIAKKNTFRRNSGLCLLGTRCTLQTSAFHFCRTCLLCFGAHHPCHVGRQSRFLRHGVVPWNWHSVGLGAWLLMFHFSILAKTRLDSTFPYCQAAAFRSVSLRSPVSLADLVRRHHPRPTPPRPGPSTSRPCISLCCRTSPAQHPLLSDLEPTAASAPVSILWYAENEHLFCRPLVSGRVWTLSRHKAPSASLCSSRLRLLLIVPLPHL